MRIRSIKPEFWSSEDIADIKDWAERLLFLGLWQYVDDNGVGRDVPKLIVADLFPLEDDPLETLARVSRGLQKLSELGRIVRYTVEGKPFLHVANWHHQRIDKPNKPRYPLPTSDNAVIRESVARVSRDIPETPAPVTGEQGNRGTEETPQPPRLETVTGAAIALAPRVSRSRQRIDAMNATARPVEVYTFMHDYEQASPTPMDQKTLSQIETAITPLIASGIPAEQVAAGIRAWEASDSFSPTQIPAFVHKAGAKAAAPTGVGKPTIKAVGWLNAADQLIEGMEA